MIEKTIEVVHHLDWVQHSIACFGQYLAVERDNLLTELAY